MLRLSAIACLIMIAASPLPALAYTQEDADACTPDAFKICQAAIPDPDRVRDCLVQNKRALSPACAVVINRPASATMAREAPQNIQKTKY
jgi:hypothetical protein